VGVEGCNLYKYFRIYFVMNLDIRIISIHNISTYIEIDIPVPMACPLKVANSSWGMAAEYFT